MEESHIPVQELSSYVPEDVSHKSDVRSQKPARAAMASTVTKVHLQPETQYDDLSGYSLVDGSVLDGARDKGDDSVL